ncbi:MAG: hypothetical protein KBT47_02395, partial [Armatimonadetes bacterium]|nr:hypothetical protein [Candidatus Hippobium faecium]
MAENFITVHEYDDKYGTYIGNGTLGLRLFGSGTATRDGEPAPCFMAGLYSRYLILPIPSIGHIAFKGFEILKENYSQTLDFETETLNTEYTIKNGEKSVDLEIKTSVLRLKCDENKVYIQIKGKPNYTGILPFEAPVRIVKNQDFMLNSPILGNDPNVTRIEENKEYKGENIKYNIY